MVKLQVSPVQLCYLVVVNFHVSVARVVNELWAYARSSNDGVLEIREGIRLEVSDVKEVDMPSYSEENLVLVVIDDLKELQQIGLVPERLIHKAISWIVVVVQSRKYVHIQDELLASSAV